MTDHTVTLTQAERTRVAANQRPKDAATMLIIDRTSARPKVLMGKRHASHKFMPGKYVFPGGRLDEGDRRMVATGALPQICEDRLLKRAVRPSIGKARALALAAIRETFEETGLLFGTDEFGAPETAPEGSWSDFAGHGIFRIFRPSPSSPARSRHHAGPSASTPASSPSTPRRSPRRSTG